MSRTVGPLEVLADGKLLGPRENGMQFRPVDCSTPELKPCGIMPKLCMVVPWLRGGWGISLDC